MADQLACPQDPPKGSLRYILAEMAAAQCALGNSISRRDQLSASLFGLNGRDAVARLGDAVARLGRVESAPQERWHP